MGALLETLRHPLEMVVRSKFPLQWVSVYRCCCVHGDCLAQRLVLARSHVPELVGKSFLVGSGAEGSRH